MIQEGAGVKQAALDQLARNRLDGLRGADGHR
jgi:hypothetical protein